MNRATYNRPKVAIGGHKSVKAQPETYYRGVLSTGVYKTKDIKEATAWKQAGFKVTIVTVSPF